MGKRKTTVSLLALVLAAFVAFVTWRLMGIGIGKMILPKLNNDVNVSTNEILAGWNEYVESGKAGLEGIGVRSLIGDAVSPEDEYLGDENFEVAPDAQLAAAPDEELEEVAETVEEGV